jgi:hypothetical protein
MHVQPLIAYGFTVCDILIPAISPSRRLNHSTILCKSISSTQDSRAFESPQGTPNFNPNSEKQETTYVTQSALSSPALTIAVQARWDESSETSSRLVEHITPVNPSPEAGPTNIRTTSSVPPHALLLHAKNCSANEMG